MYDYKVNKYPWLVRIWERKKYAGPSSSKITYADEYPGRGFCGGTLVARRHVITAAHCLYHWNEEYSDIALAEMQPDEVAVRIGDHNIEDDFDETELPQRFVNVLRIEKHSQWHQKIGYYTDHQNGYDIAILELAIDLDLNTYTPACLAKSGEALPFGQYGIAVGWGAIREFPWYGLPEVPHEVSLRIVRPNAAKCSDRYDGNRNC